VQPNWVDDSVHFTKGPFYFVKGVFWPIRG
jgi:hypothetical protein